MKSLKFRVTALIISAAVLSFAPNGQLADVGTCGGAIVTVPFTDVAGNLFFCDIAAAYFSGLTNGTSATTFSPDQSVPRDQMAAFTTRSLDQSLRRGNRRAALKQWWTTNPQLQYAFDLGSTTIGVSTFPNLIQSDGADLWVANGNSVARVRASDGKLLETWTGATAAFGVLIALNRVFITGFFHTLYMIDPRQPVGPVTTVSDALGQGPNGIAFDGQRIWTANNAGFGTGSISIITPSNTLPWPVRNVTQGLEAPLDILFDGSSMWVTDFTSSQQGSVKKLDLTGAIVQTILVDGQPSQMAFDGTNIWVVSGSAGVTVIRASSGVIIATLTGNGLSSPFGVGFDGERILVTNPISNRLCLWKASSLTPMGFFEIGSSAEPTGVCSDGLNFWITLRQVAKVARF